MINVKRIWGVVDIDTAEELAEKLTKCTWTLCSGFHYSGYLFLNDSFSEDGAQEYGIIKELTGKQVESVTFSWCDYDRAFQLICKITVGDFDSASWNSGIDIAVQVRSSEKHGRCLLCA